MPAGVCVFFTCAHECTPRCMLVFECVGCLKESFGSVVDQILIEAVLQSQYQFQTDSFVHLKGTCKS